MWCRPSPRVIQGIFALARIDLARATRTGLPTVKTVTRRPVLSIIIDTLRFEMDLTNIGMQTEAYPS